MPGTPMSVAGVSSYSLKLGSGFGIDVFDLSAGIEEITGD